MSAVGGATRVRRDSGLIGNDEAKRTRRREAINSSVRYVILLGMGLVMLCPRFWLVGASFKTNAEIFTEIGMIPRRIDFGAHIEGWKTSTQYSFTTYFLNSFLIVIPRVVVTVISRTLVAFSFARFEYPGRKLLFSIMIATMMLPQVVLNIPQYLLFKEMGMIDTFGPLIIPSAFATDTFFTFLLVQFPRGIPRDMEAAAQIDGCNPVQLLYYILVPLLKPAIISVVVFQFIWSMNDFMGPLIHLSSVDKYPVSLALKMSAGATEEVEWARPIAISIVALLPSISIFLSAQKYFIDGATGSGVKG